MTIPEAAKALSLTTAEVVNLAGMLGVIKVEPDGSVSRESVDSYKSCRAALKR